MTVVALPAGPVKFGVPARGTALATTPGDGGGGGGGVTEAGMVHEVATRAITAAPMP
jgi:hypothetical protein